LFIVQLGAIGFEGAPGGWPGHKGKPSRGGKKGASGAPANGVAG
jgi:hypothetical protein